PWIELDAGSQPVYLADSGRTHLVQPFAPALALPAIVRGGEPDPRLAGLAGSVLRDPGLLSQLTAEQCEAMAKACVLLAAGGEQSADLEAWLYLCAVKHEALYISTRKAFSSNEFTLMYVHLASALDVKGSPQAARM